MERQVVDVCAGLQARGHSVTLTVNKGIEAYAAEIAEADVRAIAFGSDRRFDGRVYSRLLQVCSDAEAEALVGVSFNSTFFSRLVARRLGLASLTAEHASNRVAPRKLLLSNRMLSSWTDATIACADAQVDSLVAEYNDRSKIRVVHNGVDTSAFFPSTERRHLARAALGISETTPLVGMVAAHRVEKRYDRFVSLIDALRRQNPSVVGIGFGGGAGLARDREAAAESGIGESVRFVGPFEDMVGAYNACDAVVLLSDSETLPLALMEAQACGCPVVVMRVGGVLEAFVDGTSGYGVEAGNITDAAAAVAVLLSDRDSARRMGEAGRAWVTENRSLAQMVDGYERVLQDAVTQRGSQAAEL